MTDYGVIFPVAYIDHLGYLRCADCTIASGKGNRDIPVYADTSPHNVDSCDCCHKTVSYNTRRWQERGQQ